MGVYGWSSTTANTLIAFNGNCGIDQEDSGGGTWEGDRASPTGGNWTNAAVESRMPGFFAQLMNCRNSGAGHIFLHLHFGQGNVTSGCASALVYSGTMSCWTPSWLIGGTASVHRQENTAGGFRCQLRRRNWRKRAKSLSGIRRNQRRAMTCTVFCEKSCRSLRLHVPDDGPLVDSANARRKSKICCLSLSKNLIIASTHEK